MRASSGVRSISARIASRARSMLRDSSHCAMANRKTTVPASAHSPQKHRADDRDEHQHVDVELADAERRTARRAGNTPPVTAAVTNAAMRQRFAPRRRTGARGPTASAPADTATSSRAGRRGRRRDGLLVLEPGAHAGLGDRVDDDVGRQQRGVVLHMQALADDVRGDVFDAAERRQAALQDGGLLAAAHARRRGRPTRRAACSACRRAPPTAAGALIAPASVRRVSRCRSPARGAGPAGTA